MKNKIIVVGPVLSQSGYGEQARFALRALRSKEDIFDIYISPTSWGLTSWVSVDNDERRWIDERIAACHVATQNGAVFDTSLQISIPNEWKRLAKVDVGYTAGIETDKVAPIWLQKVNEMDKVIVVSNHAKEVFANTIYEAVNPNSGQNVVLKNTCEIDVVNYPVRKFKKEKLDINLDYNFNYLAISQWGPRKNFENLVKWFIEENAQNEVGLVIKASIQNNSLIDRMHTEKRLQNMIEAHGDIKCKIYLVHGDLTDEEMTGLYQHPKIKCLISTTHGEGYGLPLFEAAYNGLPVICTNWSGQKDFLYITQKNGKRKPMFGSVEYDLQPVQKEAVWNGVIEQDSKWSFPREESFKKRLTEVREEYSRYKRNASKLKKSLHENFSEEIMYDSFCQSLGIVKVSKELLEWNKAINDMDEL